MSDNFGVEPWGRDMALTSVSALVLSTEADVMNPTAQMIYSITAALRETAYHLVVMPYFREKDPMTPIRHIVKTGSADGVVLNQICRTIRASATCPSAAFPSPRMATRTWGSTIPILTSTTILLPALASARWSNGSGGGGS